MTRQKTQGTQKRRAFGEVFRGMFNRGRRHKDLPPSHVELPVPWQRPFDGLLGGPAPSRRRRRRALRPRHRPAAVQRRREANKRARAARRIHRQAAGR